MCNTTDFTSNALITAHNHGLILGMVAWFLACLLALCTAIKIIGRCRSPRLRHIPLSQDIILVGASLCGIGSTIVISIAVDSGLGKRRCLLSPADLNKIQIKVFVSTILFVLALSISKCSMLVFLHQLADTALQKIGVMTVGVVVVIWTLAVMAGIVFECEMPRPWEIWTGKCIPMLPFWIAATTTDILIDTALIILSAHLIWTKRLDYHQKTLATSLISLRLLLIATSALRLTYLHPALTRTDPTFTSIPYYTTTQVHSTLSVLIACAISLKPLASLLVAPPAQPQRTSKHWSGTTIGGTPYESYDPFVVDSHTILREPLHAIQKSMSTPTSAAGSRKSLHERSGSTATEDILLPDIPLPLAPTAPLRVKKAPARPPPPREEERPDLSMFRGSVGKVGRGRSLAERGLA